MNAEEGFRISYGLLARETFFAVVSWTLAAVYIFIAHNLILELDAPLAGD